MGRKTDVTKASLAAAFVAAGGVSASQAGAAANPNAANIEGVVSSYFGPLGLEDDFQAYVKVESGFTSFQKYWKIDQEDATRTVITFSSIFKINPPPGFEPKPE